MKGDLTIVQGNDGAEIGIAAQADRLDLGDLLKQLEAGASLQGGVDSVTLAMSSRGRTMRALLQRADLSLKTRRGRIRSGDDKAGTPWSLDIAAAEMKARKAQPITISVDGKHRDTPFALTANIVTLEGLATGTRPWPLGVSLQALQASLTATGRVTRPFQGKGFDLTFDVSGEDLQELDPLIDYVIPLRGEYRVTGHFRDDTNRYNVSDIQVRVGKSDIGGSIVFVMAKPRPKIEARLRSGMVHYDDLEFVERAREPEDKGRVIPEYTLPVEALLAVNLNVDLEAERIRMRGGDLGDLALKATLQNGTSVLSARVTNDIGGRINFRHEINANPDPPLNWLLLTARDLNYGLILTSAGVAEFAEGRVDVDIELVGPGATQRSFLAQANGRITVIGGPGRIASREYGLWSSDLVLTMLTARWRREAMTEINCIVGRIDVEDGVAKTDKLMLDTARLTIAGSGTLDLDTEELDLLLSPRPKQARLVSVANPVRVTGTLAAPEVAVTVLPTRRRAATGLLAGLINPALLVLTFSDIGSGGGNPCVAATQKLDATASE